MILIVCVDDAGGLGFNRRRQSQDRALRARMLGKWGRLWMNAYSAGQFAKEDPVTADEDFLEKSPRVPQRRRPWTGRRSWFCTAGTGSTRQTAIFRWTWRRGAGGWRRRRTSLAPPTRRLRRRSM